MLIGSSRVDDDRGRAVRVFSYKIRSIQRRQNRVEIISGTTLFNQSTVAFFIKTPSTQMIQYILYYCCITTDSKCGDSNFERLPY